MHYTLVCIVFWTFALIVRAHSSSCKDELDEKQDECYGVFKVQLFQNQSSEDMPEKKQCIDYENDDDNLIRNESCLIYPGNILNCSFSPLSVSECSLTSSVTVCGDSEQNSTVECLAAPGVTGDRIECQGKAEDYVSFVILHVMVSCPETLYNFEYRYVLSDIEILRPPPNISVSAREGALLVTWNVPFSHSSNLVNCFDYELNINNQTRSITGKLNFTEPNIDPTPGYYVTMRTKKSLYCRGTRQWSEWSDIVGLEPSPYELNYLVIGCISLGIPMVLLALLLLVRPQRVIKLIFPPIPHPPIKIKHLLDKDASIEFPSTVQTYMEDITNVDYIEQTPETAALS